MLLNRVYPWILLMLFAAPSFAAPGFGSFRLNFGSKAVDLDRFTEKADSSHSTHPPSLERLQRYEDEVAILNQLQVSRSQMESLVKEYKGSSEESENLQKLMQIAASKKTNSNTIKDQLLLKKYFQFLISTPNTDGTFQLSPSVMKKGIKKWRRIAKNFMTILLDTATQEASRQRNMTREKAYELVIKNRNFILGRAAFEGEMDTISTLYAIGKVSYDELTAILVQLSIFGNKTLEESFEIYDRGVLASHKIGKALIEAEEYNKKIMAEAQELSKTVDETKEVVAMILNEASILSGKSVNEMRTIYEICQATTSSEAKAVLAETAAISGKTMDEIQLAFLSAKSLMKQLDATIAQVININKNILKKKSPTQ